MKIQVHSGTQHIFIPLPNCLAFNGLTECIAINAIRKNADIPLTHADLRRLFAALREARKEFGHLVLVDVDSRSGDKVKITL